MDNKYIEQLRTHVKDALRTDNMRYQHTLGVANTSACLAMCHGADMNKAYIAGLLHDCAKCVPDDVKIAECEQFGLPISDIEFESPYLLHSKLGAYYAAHKYNVEDDDFYQFYASAKDGTEDSTRTRSFMFFAHAIVLASALGKEKIDLIIPENGLISLNIPINNLGLNVS
jgi:predicted HD superfamily hydrolase involved in NAD metabolism